MTILYTPAEFNAAKNFDKLFLQCENCKKPFLQTKKEIVATKNRQSNRNKTCSVKCNAEIRINRISTECAYCYTPLLLQPWRIQKHPIHFCNKICKGHHWNKTKTFGSSRSKLEHYLEQQLAILYPNLSILYNDRNIIGVELDIYIPDLNLAIELNGITHYEPIYGTNKLQYIQTRDKSKSKLCHDSKIDLCVIDTTQQKYFKPKSSQKYLDIITKIINERTS